MKLLFLTPPVKDYTLFGALATSLEGDNKVIAGIMNYFAGRFATWPAQG